MKYNLKFKYKRKINAESIILTLTFISIIVSSFSLYINYNFSKYYEENNTKQNDFIKIA